jgi:signal transduction histidine kinase
MNTYQSSAKPFSELDLQRVNFHAVLLGMAAHDLRQPLQVIQSTYEWLSGKFDAEADRMRLQRGGRAVARLAEQLDQLAAALRLYEHMTTMELSPVPLAPLSTAWESKMLSSPGKTGSSCVSVQPARPS